jgi:hypothetical protein
MGSAGSTGVVGATDWCWCWRWMQEQEQHGAFDLIFRIATFPRPHPQAPLMQTGTL